MGLGKVVVYAIVGLLALVVASAVVSAVFAAIAFVWFLVRTIATLLVLGALAYGGYKLYSLLSGSSSSGVASQSTGVSTRFNDQNRVEDLKQQYANGTIDEAELEHRIEQELGGDPDNIDRELDRERL